MAEEYGGRVEASAKSEFGFAKVTRVEKSRLLDDIHDHMDDKGYALDVWMSHGDKVTKLPPGFDVIAKTDSAPIAAMSCDSKQIYGLQFHPEVTHTVQGQKILERFILDICGCEGLWTSVSIIDDAIGQLANVKMVEQTAQCSVGDFSEAEISEAHSAGGAARGHARTGDGETATATSSAPVLNMEWVNAVVSEMGASVDMADAQTRASRVLQMFEGAVRQRCAEFTDYSKVMKMKRENALLKRAVAIQNSRMQELAPLQARVRELEAACAQYDDQLKAAERQNYSLSVNLRLAMAEQSQSPFGEGSRNHDVF